MSATDIFDATQFGALGSASRAFSITPNDSTDVAYVTRAIWVGAAGNIALVMADGSEVTFNGVQAGTLLPIRVKRVKSTGTTASLNLLGLY